MLYDDYEVEDLISDVTFQQYCLGTNEAAVAFWEELLADNEKLAMKAIEARRLFYSLNGGVTQEMFADHFSAFERKLQEAGILDKGVVAMPVRRSGRKWWYAAAAAAVIVVVVALFADRTGEGVPVNRGYTYSSDAGEKKTIQLPDGTKVILNGGSRITLHPNFNEGDRQLTLDGEAFFDVAHNAEAPFLVRANGFDVRVLGTVFNVRSYSGDARSVAALIEGKIALYFPGNTAGQPVILNPSEQIVVEHTKVPSEDTKSSDTPAPNREVLPRAVQVMPLQLMPYDSTVIETSWTENKLVFYKETLEEIARKLERWFNVEIRFESDEVKMFTYSGTFNKENVKGVLNALRLSKEFSCTYVNDRVIVLGR